MAHFESTVTVMADSMVSGGPPLAYAGVAAEIYPQALSSIPLNAQPFEQTQPSIYLDDLDPIAYAFRVQNEPEKITYILRKLHTAQDPRRTELAQELERGCITISPSMLSAFLETELLEFLFEITTKTDLPIYAFSKTEGDKKCVNQNVLNYACAVIRVIQLLVATLVNENHTAHLERFLPSVFRLFETLLKVLYVHQEPSGRWRHDDWQSTHVSLRQAVDDLVGGCFELTSGESEDSKRLAKVVSALIMRSWIRGYPSEIYYKLNIIKLALRLFSEGLPLDKRGFADGKIYATLRTLFVRELLDKAIIGADMAILAQAIKACLECHPRIVNHEWLEEIGYRRIRDAIKSEHERVKSLTASAEQYLALKHLMKLVRALVEGIPFSMRPGEDIRPPLKIWLWLFWVHNVMIRAAVRQDKDTFDDCRYILAQEAPRYYIQKDRDRDQWNFCINFWRTTRGQINQYWKDARTPIERKWARKVVDCWIDVGKAYGYLEDEAANKVEV